MSQKSQTDLHLSTELLNAFAEQALDAQEREQAMTHLATCGRCREVLFLAQEAAFAEEQITIIKDAPKEMSPAGRWFGGWKLVWVGGLATAVMALVVISVYMLRPVQGSKTAQAAKPVVEMAARAPIEPLVQPAAVPTGVAAPAKPRPAPLRRRQPAIDKFAGIAEAKPGASVDANASGAVISQQVLDNLPINGRNVRALAPQASPAPMQFAAGVVAAGAAAPKKMARASGGVVGFVGGPQSQVAAQAPAVQAQAVQQAPQPEQVPGSVNETVAVSADNAAIATEPVVSSAQITLRAMAKKAQPELPSGLPAVSSAESEGRRIALDAAGHLFFSRDAGVAWQAVVLQWTGNAVSVRSAKPTGFELVNDSGGVWSSADGLVWAKR